MGFLIAFIAVFAIIFLLALVGRAMVPTTVQPTRRDTVTAVIWSAAIAAGLVLLGTGVLAVFGFVS
ncbi:MAG TPA: hypothetical protein VL017_08835 [Devosia sp.]|nr:hypothetical protein [Devosia sp.]